MAIDTSSHLSAVALFDCVAMASICEDTRDIGRGHAEIVLDQIRSCLTQSSVGYNDISKISVSTGPGSFSGIRVGLATARGLGLGLNIPVVGISTLHACEFLALKTGFARPFLSVLDAGRNQYYCKFSGREHCWIGESDQVVHELSNTIDGICGSGAAAISAHLSEEPEIIHELRAAPISVYAELGSIAKESGDLPEPLYLRSADAKPQSNSPVSIRISEIHDG